MGASQFTILFMLSKNFLMLIVLALLIAIPSAYYLGNIWLRSYPYKVSWGVDVYLWASLLVLALGWFTILAQAIKASRLNAVAALRYE